MAAISVAAIAGYVAIAATVAAAAAGAYAAYSASEAQAQQAEYQRRQAKIQAKQASDAAAAAADAQHKQHQRILAAQRASLGAAGVTTTEGSPLLLQVDAASEAALDEARIRTAGVTASTGFTNQGKLFQYQREQARQAGYIGVGTSILGGASVASSRYYNQQSTMA